MLELRAIFRGRVQNVGFRAKALALANQMSIMGFVRNKSDGTVEILAQSDKETLELFLEKLKQLFEISQVDVHTVKAEKRAKSFEVIF